MPAVVLPPLEIDLFSADVFRERLRRAAESNPDEIVVDFAGVTFCDSTALRVLVDAAAKLDRRLLIRNPSPLFLRVAKLLDLLDSLEFEQP